MGETMNSSVTRLPFRARRPRRPGDTPEARPPAPVACSYELLMRAAPRDLDPQRVAEALLRADLAADDMAMVEAWRKARQNFAALLRARGFGPDLSAALTAQWRRRVRQAGLELNYRAAARRPRPWGEGDGLA